jgi:glycosyltransferase involved in cell wall biosynthesis
MSQRVLHYVDPAAGGHHGDFLAFFMRLALRTGIRLKVWVPERSYSYACSLVPEANDHASLHQSINEHPSHEQRLDLIRRVAASAATGDRVFFAMLDPMLSSLAHHQWRHNGIQAPWSGLLFRTSFNYPENEPFMSLAWIKSLAKLSLLRWLYRRSHPSLLTLDPFWDTSHRVPVVHIPDAMTELDRMAPAKLLQVQPSRSDRQELLFFGSIDQRKGLAEFLMALHLAPDTTLRTIHLCILGKWHPSANYPEQAEVLRALELRGLKVTLRNEVISNQQLVAALVQCDLVLAPYIDHIGSSGVVGLAAQFGKPVLTQASYQIAREVNQYALGKTANTKDPKAILVALMAMLSEEPANDAPQAEYRAWRNQSQAMASCEQWLAQWFAEGKETLHSTGMPLDRILDGHSIQ